MSGSLTLTHGTEVADAEVMLAESANPRVADTIATRSGELAFGAAMTCNCGKSPKQARRVARSTKKREKQHKREEKKDGVKRT